MTYMITHTYDKLFKTFSSGENYFSAVIPGFNLTCSYMCMRDFVKLEEAYESNTRCKRRLPKVLNTFHREKWSPLLTKFDYNAALR